MEGFICARCRWPHLGRPGGSLRVYPVLKRVDTPVWLIAHLVHPEPSHLPAQLDQTLVPKLIPQAQLACPAAVVALAIHFDRELSFSRKEREIEVVLLDTELRN